MSASDTELAKHVGTITYRNTFASENANVSNIAYAETVYVGSHKSTARHPWTVPRSLNRFFTGREDTLRNIADAFQVRLCHDPPIESIYVIAGLGGTGKSEICIKYADDHRNDYWGIFWIDCATSVSIGQCFQRIGSLCGVLEPGLANVKDFLSSSSERWLMIVDNADDIRHNYSTYFPSTKISNSDIIVTTRNPELCVKYHTTGFIHLDQLDLLLAVKLLLQVANIPETTPCDKYEAATKIVKQLDRHTLAILHAGAFIESQCDIEEYLTILRQNPSALFKTRREQEHSTYETIHRTFEISIERMKNLKDVGDVAASDALELLNDLCFLHHEVPLATIAINASAYAKSILDRPQQSLEHFYRSDSLWKTALLKLSVLNTLKMATKNDSHALEEQAYELLSLRHENAWSLPEYYLLGKSEDRMRRWNNATKMLKSFSLIVMQGGTGTISIHPLVHAWAKERMDDGMKSKSWFNTANLLALSCSGHTDHSLFFNVLKVHLNVCCSRDIETHIIVDGKPQVVLPVLWQLAWTLYQLFEYVQADGIIAVAFDSFARHEFSKGRMGELAHLYLRRLQALILRGVGKDVESLTELQLVLKCCKKYIGPHDRLTLLLHCDIADTYIAVGRAEEAIALINDMLLIKRESVASDHEDILLLQHLLGNAFKENGQIKESIPLFQTVVSKMENRYHAERPLLLAAQCELAYAYLDDDQAKKAIQLLEYVAEIRDRRHSEESRERLSAQYELACARLQDSQVKEAIQLLEYVVETQSRVFPEQDKDRLASQYELARAYLEDDQLTKSIELFEQVVKIRDNVLPVKDRDRLVSQHSLAYAYLKNNQITKSIKLLERVVEVQASICQNDYDLWLSSLDWLSKAYMQAERFEEVGITNILIAKLEHKMAAIESNSTSTMTTYRRKTSAVKSVPTLRRWVHAHRYTGL